MADARDRKFDVVVAEGLDRLSREQVTTAALFQQLSFLGIMIFTRTEGEVNELHVGLKGTMNALFLKDLAIKTHRGIEGRVRQGKSGGGRAYGYCVVDHRASDGTPIRGDREINEREAVNIRRIFAEFAAGKSPRAIARDLNQEGLKGPSGKPWRDTTIRGHAGRRTGILRNDLYVGRLLWNKQSYRRNPDTGKRVARPREEREHVATDVPELRIIDQSVWEAVQSRLDAIRASPGSQKLRRSEFWKHRRPGMSSPLRPAGSARLLANITRSFTPFRARCIPGSCRLPAFDQDAKDNAVFLAKGKLAMPVLAIGGEKSFGKGMAEIMRFAASDVREGVIPDFGHWIMEENPAATIAMVRTFLEA